MSDILSRINEVQFKIDNIKNEAQSFKHLLDMVLKESVYMNLLYCPPLELLLLARLIEGIHNVLSPPCFNNLTWEDLWAKEAELKKLRDQVTEFVDRLTKLDFLARGMIYNLISGHLYCKIYDEVIIEEELAHIREQELQACKKAEAREERHALCRYHGISSDSGEDN